MIPDHLADSVKLGTIVRVPLSGRRTRGYVVEVVEERPGPLKAIAGTSGDYPVFDAKLLQALIWAAHHYVAPVSVMLERTAPPNLAEGRGSPGIGRLYIDGRKVGEKEIPVTVPLAFALSGEGLCCGWDSLTPACSAYRTEFPFTGTIRKVVVDVGN